MDGSQFDQLVKRLGTTRITRLTALRGLAVGAVAATLGFAAPDEADAKCKKSCSECQKKKKHKSKSGKTRIQCKAKANGTLCSIGTCQSGICTRECDTADAAAADVQRRGQEWPRDRRRLRRAGLSALCRRQGLPQPHRLCQRHLHRDLPGVHAGRRLRRGRGLHLRVTEDAATTTCVALPAPPAIAGSCPGSCPAGKVCIGSAGLVLCTDPCTAP